MRSLVLTANAQLALKDVESAALQADECFVRVRAAGVCSSDIPRAFDKGAYHYPLVMGHEVAGVVESCGAAVKRVKPGDRVAMFPLIPCFKCKSCAGENYHLCSDYDYYGSRRNGGFCGGLAVKEWNLLVLPPDADLLSASVMEPMAVAAHAAERLRPQAKEKIAVLGAGFIGLTLVQVLKAHYGCGEVVCADRNSHKLDIARSLGARTVLLGDQTMEEEFTQGAADSFDVVFEVIGAPRTYAMALALAARRGRVAWVGNITGNLTVEKALVSRVLRKELTVQGIWNSRYSPDRPSDWSLVRDLLAGGVLTPRKLFSHVVPLEEGPKILNEMHESKKASGRGKFQKVVFSQP